METNQPNQTAATAGIDPDAKERQLVALFMDLTGVTEIQARSVYSHLDLIRSHASQISHPPSVGN